MSRVGKAPVAIPAGVQVTLSGRDVSIKGAKGELKHTIPVEFSAAVAENKLSIKPTHDAVRLSPVWGTNRAILASMVKGVTEGFSISLKLVGVGYRANVQGTTLNLAVGYSHPVNLAIPKGITVVVNEMTEIVISGADKAVVGQFAANVRAKKAPEPFKGKGVRYANEFIVMKEGKKK